MMTKIQKDKKPINPSLESESKKDSWQKREKTVFETFKWL